MSSSKELEIDQLLNTVKSRLMIVVRMEVEKVTIRMVLRVKKMPVMILWPKFSGS